MNQNKGIDYHLRALGMENRAGWTILARDDRIYSNGIISCKPDFVLSNPQEGKMMVIEWKSRDLGEGEPTEYEMWQAVINTITVKDCIERDRGQPNNYVEVLLDDRYEITGMKLVKPEQDEPLEIAAVLIYGDGQKRQVDFSDNDEITVRFDAQEFFVPGKPVAASNLALTMVCSTEEVNRMTVYDNVWSAPRFIHTGANFEGVPEYARENGTAAHKAVRDLGPET
jgi:hypothetical protein